MLGVEAPRWIVTSDLVGPLSDGIRSGEEGSAQGAERSKIARILWLRPTNLEAPPAAMHNRGRWHQRLRRGLDDGCQRALERIGPGQHGRRGAP